MLLSQVDGGTGSLMYEMVQLCRSVMRCGREQQTDPPFLAQKSKAGEYIDMTVGIAMGISTMAAAALGNTISDVAGVGLGGFIETMATKLGLPQNKLSRFVC